MADVQQKVFDLYMAGRKREAFDIFGHYLAFNSIPRANDYVLVARGVLPEDSIFRGPATPSGHPQPPLTAAQKAEIRAALDTYLKPYLIA
jgi:hypothetical protein